MDITIQKKTGKLADLWDAFKAASWFDELLLTDEGASTGTGQEIGPRVADRESSPVYGGL